MGVFLSIAISTTIAVMIYSAAYPSVWEEIAIGMNRDEVSKRTADSPGWKRTKVSDQDEIWKLARPIGDWILTVRYDNDKVDFLNCKYESVLGRRQRNRSLLTLRAPNSDPSP
jgi:hypothetical protein